MQMSKQERIIIIVLLVLVILGVGIFIFLLPNFNNIDVNNKNLAAAQSEYSSILEELEREKTIDSDIKTAYEEGKDLADGFYNDLNTVEADEIMRQFIAKGKDIRIDGLQLSPFSTETLSISVFAPTEVTYPLKDFSNTVIGGAADDDTVDVENMSERELISYAKEVMALALAISEPVTVGVANVSFNAYSDDLQNLHDFVDMLNEGIYDETIVDADGKPQRKATYVNGATFELTDKAAQITLNAYGGSNSAPTESAEDTSSNNSQTESEAQGNSDFGRYSMSFNVKLYCIEPVADPFANSSQSE